MVTGSGRTLPESPKAAAIVMWWRSRVEFFIHVEPAVSPHTVQDRVVLVSGYEDKVRTARAI